MRRSRKKTNKKPFMSMFIVLLTAVIMTGALLSSAAKTARADSYALDKIEKQIKDLDNLQYSSKDILKIVKMTNDNIDFYIELVSNKIVIGIMDPKDNPIDVREIPMHDHDK